MKQQKKLPYHKQRACNNLTGGQSPLEIKIARIKILSETAVQPRAFLKRHRNCDEIINKGRATSSQFLICGVAIQ
jgi:hypothetical protein